jgi:hypothetical protein
MIEILGFKLSERIKLSHAFNYRLEDLCAQPPYHHFQLDMVKGLLNNSSQRTQYAGLADYSSPSAQRLARRMFFLHDVWHRSKRSNYPWESLYIAGDADLNTFQVITTSL